MLLTATFTAEMRAVTFDTFRDASAASAPRKSSGPATPASGRTAARRDVGGAVGDLGVEEALGAPRRPDDSHPGAVSRLGQRAFDPEAVSPVREIPGEARVRVIPAERECRAGDRGDAAVIRRLRGPDREARRSEVRRAKAGNRGLVLDLDESETRGLEDRAERSRRDPAADELHGLRVCPGVQPSGELLRTFGESAGVGGPETARPVVRDLESEDLRVPRQGRDLSEARVLSESGIVGHEPNARAAERGSGQDGSSSPVVSAMA